MTLDDPTPAATRKTDPKLPGSRTLSQIIVSGIASSGGSTTFGEGMLKIPEELSKREEH